ncbi:hypothetical protein SAMN04515647_1301 [Cohaesibacter sp. ES.047]|uniref:hypothetical protein n=1 Tax=Cohaesibacter sp. ES.047 TaxID=1798205 RepID=UPI000BC009AB|nr:hypothetical protein [Cohaesibacter sp. ES.047]SNY91096.1 hypothetical protein SAMN04515647_1301 [Cohaesibacter sp. ES.047]
MIAIAMYILLGAFVTLLLTLFVLPLIWRRAVKLTEIRIKAEMPISYSELQAEKDMQRAEQAIQFRGLEVIAEERLEDVANKAMKIDRLHKTLKEKDEAIEARQAEITALQGTLYLRENDGEDTRLTLKTTAEELEEARKTIAAHERTIVNLEENAEELDTQIGEHKIETVAQLTRIENLKQEIAALTNERNAAQTAKAEVNGQLAQKTAELERTKEQRNSIQERIDSLQSDIADKDTRIEHLGRQLERAHEGKPDLDLSQRLAEAESRRVEAEAKVASLSLQLGYQQQAPEEADISSMISKLQSEKQTVEEKLADAIKEKDRLSSEIRSMKKDAEEKAKNAELSPGERELRDQIRIIATRITDVAADMEGEGSPILALLEKDKTETKAAPEAKEAKEAPSDEAKAPEAEATSESEEQTDASAAETDEPTGEPNKTNGSENENGNGQTTAKGNDKPDHDETDDEDSDHGGGLIAAAKKKASDPWTAVFSLADRIREMRDRPGDKSA